MSVSVERDCITLRDGVILCYDREDKKLYELVKREVSADTVANYDLMRLLDVVANSQGGTVKNMSSDDLETLLPPGD